MAVVFLEWAGMGEVDHGKKSRKMAGSSSRWLVYDKFMSHLFSCYLLCLLECNNVRFFPWAAGWKNVG